MTLNEKPIRQPTLAQQVYEILRLRILSGFYSHQRPIPSEDQLSFEFNVSRTTIRGAVDRLTAQGLLRRRHGKGTFIVKSQLISNPLDKFIDFQDLISSNGFSPSYKQIDARVVLADKLAQRMLLLSDGDRVLEITKMWTADGNPIVYCLNQFPLWIFVDEKIPENTFGEGITEPLFSFFDNYCQQSVDYYISSIRSGIVKTCGIKQIALDFDQNTSVLVIDEIGYNPDDKPIHRSIEFHPDNLMQFKLIRRRP